MNKKKQRKENPGVLKMQLGGMARAAEWPVHEVLVSRGWQQHGNLVSVLVARRSPVTGKIACGLLLVDLACLGIKSAQVRLFKNVSEYVAGLRAHAIRLQPMESASFNLAAKIVYTGLNYAAGLGFKPDAVFKQAEPLFSDADPDACELDVPIGGEDGKPLFIQGPHDNPQRIMDQLIRSVGHGNFNFIVPIDPHRGGMGIDKDDLEWDSEE